MPEGEIKDPNELVGKKRNNNAVIFQKTTSYPLCLEMGVGVYLCGSQMGVNALAEVGTGVCECLGIAQEMSVSCWTCFNSV